MHETNDLPSEYFDGEFDGISHGKRHDRHHLHGAGEGPPFVHPRIGLVNGILKDGAHCLGQFVQQSSLREN